MGESVGTRQLNFQIPPRVGNIGVFAVTAVASQVTFPVVAFRRYVTIQNDSATVNLYLSVGAPASVPVPVPATAATFGSTATAAMIPPNSSLRVELQPGVDGVIGLITSAGVTTARIWYSSNQEGYAIGNPPGQA